MPKPDAARRRLLLGLPVGFLVATVPPPLLLAACDDGKGSAKAPPVPQRPRVALVMKTLANPFFVDMERGARRAASELGVDLVVRTAAQETSVDQQIALIETLIREHVAAIAIAPADSVKLIPVLKKAQDAGVAVVNIDNRLDAGYAARVGLANVPFVSADNARGAYLAARALAERAPKPAEAAVIEGIRSAANGEERRQGALKAFAETPGLTVVASETANWKLEEAYEVTRRVLGDHPKVSLIFCANDMMALGAVRYLEEAGRRSVLVAGYDALSEARKALLAGQIVATIDQKADRQGYAGIANALHLIRGEPVPPETMIEVELVTAANALR